MPLAIDHHCISDCDALADAHRAWASCLASARSELTSAMTGVFHERGEVELHTELPDGHPVTIRRVRSDAEFHTEIERERSNRTIVQRIRDEIDLLTGLSALGDAGTAVDDGAWSIVVAGLDHLAEDADEALNQLAFHTATNTAANARALVPAEERLLSACHHHALLLDAAIYCYVSGLHGQKIRPSPSFYPAVLLEHILVTLRNWRTCDMKHVFLTIEAVSPELIVNLDAAIQEIDFALHRDADWPKHESIRALTRAIEHVHPLWLREAAHYYAATRSDRDREVLAWLTNASFTLERFASPLGWLRVTTEYLRELLYGATRLIREGHASSTFFECIEHELAFAVSVARTPDGEAEEIVKHNTPGGTAFRQRLKRGRERCLARWSLLRPDPEWDEAAFGEALTTLADALRRTPLSPIRTTE